MFIATAVFYMAALFLIHYWYTVDKTTHTRLSWIVLPFIMTFEFFLAGFLMVSLVSIIWRYWPEIITLIQ